MEWNLSLHPVPALLTAHPLIPFTQEIMGCTNVGAKGANIISNPYRQNTVLWPLKF